MAGIGCGKTTFLLQLLKKYLKTHSFDYVFWCSPTSTRDKKVRSVLGKAPAGVQIVYDTDFPLTEIEQLIDEKLEEYDLTLKYIPVYWKYLRLYKSVKYDSEEEEILELFSDDELELLNHFKFEPPTKFPNGKPTFAIVVDDFLGDKHVFSTHMNSQFNRFITTMRHRRTSVFVSVQSWTQTIPPSLRSMVNIFALWRCANPKIKKAMAETMCGHYLTPDKFLELWDTATKDDIHDAFVGILQSPEGERFRKNLNESLGG